MMTVILMTMIVLMNECNDNGDVNDYYDYDYVV